MLSWTQALASEPRLVRRPVRVHVLCPAPVIITMMAEEALDPNFALVMMGGRPMPPERIAAELVGMIGSGRVCRTTPSWNAVLLRMGGIAARVMNALLRLFIRVGERLRGRYRP